MIRLSTEQSRLVDSLYDIMKKWTILTYARRGSHQVKAGDMRGAVYQWFPLLLKKLKLLEKPRQGLVLLCLKCKLRYFGSSLIVDLGLDLPS